MPKDNSSILEGLKAGNARFVENVVQADEARRAELEKGQQPYAIVLGCADSRVAPELAFDVGLGELFVVRVAGNVANTSSIASIEYAVANLGTRLILVLAHESCGAVGAALAGGDVGENLNHLVAHITPAVESCDDSHVNAVAKHNARLNAERLTRRSEILRQAVENDGLEIVPAFYNFRTGVVDFL